MPQVTSITKLLEYIGGFGKVYKGIVSHSKGRSMAAIKRLDRRFGQGDCEFWKELSMLSRYTHKNLISLLGFCDEAGERIIVYEYACNGSLDRHLCSPSLTWTQRIKICLDAANGLSYLHDHHGSQQRVLHRDIKSSNILLDANWNAKVSDMGLSKLGPANQQYTIVYTNIVGTPGYCDPQYMYTYMLTKESDIYSFGVVLFEVLCGKLCFNLNKDNDLEILVPSWKRKYKHNLQDVVFQDLRPSINSTSLEIFSNIAFQCLHDSREQRPTISQVVEKLGRALEFQEVPDKRLLEVKMGNQRAFHRTFENMHVYNRGSQDTMREMTITEFERFLKTLDTDRDGRISLEALLQAIRNNGVSRFVSFKAERAMKSAYVNRNGVTDKDDPSRVVAFAKMLNVRIV